MRGYVTEKPSKEHIQVMLEKAQVVERMQINVLNAPMVREDNVALIDKKKKVSRATVELASTKSREKMMKQLKKHKRTF